MLTQQILKDSLHYNQKTGIFTWIKSGSGRELGSVAGSSTLGYIRIAINGKRYQAHRLAFLYMTGNFPVLDIDHINGKRNCNIWQNLRECTKSQNRFNTNKNRNNTSGFKGVTFDKSKNKWDAYAMVNNKRYRIGLYATAALASAEREEFCKTNHGEFYRVAAV